MDTSGAHGTRGGLDWRAVGRQGSGGERTWNMPIMLVTLDVLKLTGWLNLYAACRVERRACDHAGARCGLGGAGASVELA